MSRARRNAGPLPVRTDGWVLGLEQWKQHALRELLRELDHVCSGPLARPKSFCVSEAIHNVVARDFDPASQMGLHLAHIISGALAQQLTDRSDLHPGLHRLLPGANDIPVEFMLQYINSRWWIDAYLQLEGVTCGDLREVIQQALRAAEAESRELQEA